MRTLSGQNIPNIDPPDSEHPFGKARNSNPPSARNGTPLREANLMTDGLYAMLAVMKEAGIIPDESVENIDVSQFKDAILSLIGTVPNPDKVIYDAPELDFSNLNLLAKFTEALSNDDFNTWIGVSEAIGKLTVLGVVTLKVRNFTIGPVVATKGTSVYAGAPGLFSAGFIQTDTGDNSDLQKVQNVVGELADDFNFTDTTTYFPVLVALKGKPMVDAFNFWTQNDVQRFLSPAQPGLHYFPLSSEWDESYIKDLPRLVFTANFVFFEHAANGEVNFYLNAAINDLLQLVSTNGEDAVTITISDAGAFTISFYTPLAGQGSLLSLGKFWQFNSRGFLLTKGSIILSSSDALPYQNGEIWYDALLGKLMGKEAGTEGNLIGVDVQQGSMYVRDNATETVISTSGESNKVKFTNFDTLGPNTTLLVPSLATQDVLLNKDGVYEIIISMTPNSGVGPAAEYGFGLYSNNGVFEHGMFHNHRNMAGGGGESGSVSLSGQEHFGSGTKLELYIWNEDNTTNIIISDCTISVKLIRELPFP